MWGDIMKNELEKEVVRCACGSWTSPKLLKIEGLKIRGSVCPKCGETYLNGEDAMMLSEYRRLKDRILEGKVTISGNSFNIRIPIGLVRALGLKKGNTVNIKVNSPKELIINIA